MLAENGAEPRLSVVFLPPNAWPLPHDSQAAQAAPANTTLHHLAQMNVRWRVLVPTARPWNLLDRGNPLWRGIDPLRTLKVLLRHRKADVIVSVFEGNALCLLLLRKLFFFKPKIILWDASPGNPWRVLKWIQGIVLPRYDGLMMLTQAQKAYLETHYPLRGPVETIGYNVDETFFRPLEAAPVPSPCEPEPGYVLAVGDDLSRDYATLLETARESGERFVIKTRWRPQDSVPSNVTFISQRLDDEAFRLLYARAKMVVLPLRHVVSAGGITSLFEAMAMGKPMIVSASSITADFVSDGADAMVVPAGDARALGLAIKRVAADAPLAQSLGGQARQRIEQQLSTRRLAQRMLHFFNHVCGRDDPPAKMNLPDKVIL